eukprot:TRINITY_DN4198_c0_g2_i1.p1 TRINITY_DN4198_c0_g2~~TRINITY_DN4198_c0_g2_i1.p1  ORF type:complete len:106 (+),score=8.20 TRINITY_DN4198_c0_g2_i1:480-797(+)
MFPFISPVSKQTMNLVFTERTRSGIFLLYSNDTNKVFIKVAAELKSSDLLFFAVNASEKEGKILYDNLRIGTKNLPHIEIIKLSLIHICRCRRYAVCRSRWSPYH